MRADALPIIALCAHANAYLASGDRSVLDDARTNFALRTVEDWSFRRGAMELAASLPGYLARLAGEGVTLLRPLLEGFHPDPGRYVEFGWATDGDAGIEIWNVSSPLPIGPFAESAELRLIMKAGKSGLLSLGAAPGSEEPSRRLSAAFEDGPLRLGDYAPEFRAVRFGDPALVDLGEWPDRDFWPRALDPRAARKGDAALRALRFLVSPLWREEISRREQGPEVEEALRSAACDLIASLICDAPHLMRRAA